MCGQFVPWSADSSTYWGDSTMTVPPDPDYYCTRCAEKCKQEAIRKGYVMNAYWIKPKWQLEAMKAIRRG